MNFTTWINNHPAKDLLSETDIHNMRTVWDLAIDEAVKIALITAKCKKENDNLVGEVVAENIAEAIKELKENK